MALYSEKQVEVFNNALYAITDKYKNQPLNRENLEAMQADIVSYQKGLEEKGLFARAPSLVIRLFASLGSIELEIDYQNTNYRAYPSDEQRCRIIRDTSNTVPAPRGWEWNEVATRPIIDNIV